MDSTLLLRNFYFRFACSWILRIRPIPLHDAPFVNICDAYVIPPVGGADFDF